jgi:hypothetical protein
MKSQIRMAKLAGALLCALFLPSALLGQILSLSVSSMVFPATAFGLPQAAQTAVLTNTSAVTVSSISVAVTAGQGDYQVTTSPSTSCGVHLTAGATCTLTVTFTPAGLGARNGTIQISWANQVGLPLNLFLSGWGDSASPPFPNVIFNLPVPAAGAASVSATTMVTPTVATPYFFTSSISQTALGASCSGNTTIVVSVTYQDVAGASAQTSALGTYTITGNGTLGRVAWTSGPTDWAFWSAAGQPVQYSTTYTAASGCSPGPAVQFYPMLAIF